MDITAETDRLNCAFRSATVRLEPTTEYSSIISAYSEIQAYADTVGYYAIRVDAG